VFIWQINPFFAETGACLFSWKSKSDVQTMKNGQPPAPDSHALH
jgi:hypothetical protein